MDMGCVSDREKIDWDTLSSRFPDISFHLSLLEEDSLETYKDARGYKNARTAKGWLYDQDIQAEIEVWRRSLNLEDIDVLYVVGVGLGYHYDILKEWLGNKKERLLIFFEEDAQVLKALFAEPLGKDLLQNPQVEVCYVPGNKAWEPTFDSCVQRWLSDRVELVAIDSYAAGKEKNIAKMRWSLLRKSSLVHVGIAELLHYPLLLQNIAANFCSLPEGFHVNQMKDICKGIPAIICGAGASLADEIGEIQSLGGKALLIAGGSAITALGHQGITPHIAIALDPNDEEYTRLKASVAFETMFVYSSRLYKEVLSCMNVKPGYLCSDTGGIFESWMEKQLEIPQESLGPELGMDALSVTTLAVPLARHLGCSPILFCGVDLSYRNAERYSPGVLPSSVVSLHEGKKETKALERLIRRKNQAGKMVNTLVKWVMEAACIGEYVKKHRDIPFFNASKTGLPIPNVPTLSVQQFLSLYAKDEYDLFGLLHAAGVNTRFSTVSSSSLCSAFQVVIESLDRCSILVEDILQEIQKKEAYVTDLLIPIESGRISVLEMDLCQESAYEACLHYPFAAYNKMLDRIYPNWHSLDTVEGRRCFLQRQQALWTEAQAALKSCYHTIKEQIDELQSGISKGM